MTPEVAIVVSPRGWAEQLHRFVADHGGAQVQARILDAREALEERYEVLVAEDLTSFLTPRLVAQVRGHGRRILGVYDPTEPRGHDRLVELGVDDTVPATATPDEILRAVEALALAVTTDLDEELARLSDPDRGVVDPVAGPADGPRPGLVTAVGGPAGGPGATEIAIGLALAAGRRGERAVVVDADDVAPSLAQRLGLPLHPNLRTAIDVVEHWSGELTDTLVPLNAPSATALCGLPDARDWGELRPGEVLDVVTELACRHEHVVVNVGHRLEELGGLASAPGRYGLAREVLARADAVVAVAAGSPVGLGRVIDWIADVRALTRRPVNVVINRAPGSRFKRGELEQELRRTYSPPVVAFVPHDHRVEAAAWRGALVGSGPFSDAMDAVADRVLVETPEESAVEPAAVGGRP